MRADEYVVQELLANKEKNAQLIASNAVLRQENKEEIRRRAMAYVERYKGEMTNDLYEETKRQVEKAKIGEEPKKELRKETKTTKPTNETERKTIAKKRPTAVQADSEIRTEQPRVRRRRPTVTE